MMYKVKSLTNLFKTTGIMLLLIGRPYVPANGLVIVHELIHGKGVPEEEVVKLFDQKYRGQK